MKEKLEQINNTKLVEPSVEYETAFMEAAREFLAEGKDAGFQLNVPEGDFKDFVAKLEKSEKGIDLPEGRVPQSHRWLIDNGKFIGWAKIRHKLNEKLLKSGGHIGYGIRPKERGHGYGNRILKLALEKAKTLGINKVLLTCDDNNALSARVIENNGGVLENVIEDEEKGRLTRRYWIEIK